MIIFDLDGVLADCSHRRHFVDPKRNFTINGDHTGCWDNGWKPDYKSFYEACDKDIPIEATKTVLYDLMASDACHDIEIWSGRCESVREKTEDWLSYHFQAFFHGTIDEYKYLKNLKMRPIGDNTPDYCLKEMWLNELCADRFTFQGMKKKFPDQHEIHFVFDSDPKSISMYRRRGIFVFNCCQHDGEF